MNAKSIAPCGMNCGICMAYLREKDRCKGCMIPDANKKISVVRCRIKNCPEIKKDKLKFCFQCDDFPCARIKHLDKRYRTKYNMSMIENLENIRKSGIMKFVKSEKKRWTCSNCGGVICVHRKCCSSCGRAD